MNKAATIGIGGAVAAASALGVRKWRNGKRQTTRKASLRRAAVGTSMVAAGSLMRWKAFRMLSRKAGLGLIGRAR